MTFFSAAFGMANVLFRPLHEYQACVEKAESETKVGLWVKLESFFPVNGSELPWVPLSPVALSD